MAKALFSDRPPRDAVKAWAMLTAAAYRSGALLLNRKQRQERE